MINLKGSLFRPTGLTLFALLVIVPMQYFLAIESRCRMGSVQFVRSTSAEQKVSDRVHKWLFDQLDYSRGFENRQENHTFEFAHNSLKKRFEDEFWPPHLMALSSGVIASPVSTDAKELANGLWRVRSSVTFISVQGSEAKSGNSIVFEVDTRANPPKILSYKHEDSTYYHKEFLDTTNDSGCSKYSKEAVSHFKNGVNLIFNGDRNEARNEFSKALSLEPKFANAAIMRAQNAAFSKPEEGERLLTETIELLPERISLYTSRACLRMDQGNFKDALVDMTHAIEHDTQNWYRNRGLLYVNRGYCYSQLGRHKEALSDMNMAMKLETPKEIPINFYRGIVRQASGDTIGAFFDFMEVKQNCNGYYFDERGRPSACPYIFFTP